jgi:hypothetical protein
VLALAIYGSAAECAPGLWKPDPAIVQLDTSEEIFAIGDPHGDPNRLATVLAAAGLIEQMSLVTCPKRLNGPPTVTWKGGQKVLVITGDLIDKGCDSVGVIMLVRALQSDAATKGGRVIVTLGNHEAEFFNAPGDDPKTKDFNEQLKTWKLKPGDVGDCKDSLGLGEFLCGLPIAARVNDWFFSHAGNGGGKTIEDISKLGIQELVADDSILEARLNKKGLGGKPWFYAGHCQTEPKELLARYAAALKTTEPKVRHLVQGHQYEDVYFYTPKTAACHKEASPTRDVGQFFQRYGLLFLIDTGMSIGIKELKKSGGGALHIVGSGNDEKVGVICAKGGGEVPLWSQQQGPDMKEAFCAR